MSRITPNILLLTLLFVPQIRGSFQKIVNDVVKIVDLNKCLYLVGNVDMIEDFFISKKNEQAYVLKSNFLQFETGISCYHKHVRVSFGDAADLGMVETYKFDAFSTLIVLTDGNLEKTFMTIIERYSVQVIIIDRGFSAELANEDLKLADWEIEERYGANLRALEAFQTDRYNINPKGYIQVSVFNCTPFFYKQQNGEYNGIEYLMMNELVEPEVTKYIFYEEPRNADFWSTVAGDVTSGSSDIGMCSQWLTLHKNKNKDSSKPYMQVCGTFLVPKPYPVPYLSVVLSVKTHVWGSIIVTTFLAALLLYVTSKFYQKPSNFTNFPQCLLEIVRILSQQSLKTLPSRNFWKIRLIIILWTVSTLLITTGYSAGYTSLLTSPRYTKSINTLSDFIGYNIHWGASSESFRDELYNTSDLTLIRISQLFQLEQKKSVKNKRMSRRNYATFIKTIENSFVTDTEVLKEHNRKLLRALQECIYNYNTVILLRKNLPITNRLNRKIAYLIEGGFFKHWFRRISEQLKMNYMENFFKNSVGDDGPKHSPLTLKAMMGVFYFLLSDLTLATVVFVIEVSWNWIWRKTHETFPFVN